MSLSQLEQAVGHGPVPFGGDAEARQHRGEIEAAIDPVAERAEVSRQILTAGLMVGSLHGGFDVADDGVDRFALGPLGPLGAGDAAKAAETVADEDVVGVGELGDPRGQLGLAEPRGHVHAQADRAARVVLGHSGDEAGLGRGAASRRPTARPIKAQVKTSIFPC